MKEIILLSKQEKRILRELCFQLFADFGSLDKLEEKSPWVRQERVCRSEVHELLDKLSK